RYDQIISSHQQIQLYMKYNLIDFPDDILNELLKILKPPTIVSFTGHMIDKPERVNSRFPSYIEEAVRKAIEKKLDDLEVKIGFSSAACGADIIFLESMLDRGAEVNVVLPFNLDDFIQTSVKFAGPKWITRFNKVIKLANSVKYVTKERYLGHDSLFDYSGKVINGYAYLRANNLLTSPHLLAVMDPDTDRLIGGAASIVDKWPNKELCHIINIRDLHRNQNEYSPKLVQLKNTSKQVKKEIIHSISKKREIFTMLFADIVGYSKLKEVDYPHFYDFLKEVAEQLKEFSSYSKFINTWGDAIFTVMDKAIPLIEYAFALNHAVNNADHIKLKLPDKMNIRIALHAGPAFEIKDPITSRNNVYGSHVNRAARIEPVTLPGHIYASEQFVAQLVSEQVEYEYEAIKKNKPVKCIFALEYVGSMKLHKDFGMQSVYHIRKRTEHEGELFSKKISRNRS
ncbi:MAG: adenylate/guanylate cyclase domain-containing protein, partial [Candidatus Cloacimonetes bacterium]|nr:adenylate/guanylate cyclase domain-containing protein [Candidatus Cloacimonadota bacterium]